MTQTTTTGTNVLANAACHPTIACTDITQARNFYSKTLGLPIVEESGEQGLLLACGDGTNLYIYPRPGHTAPENTVCSFKVKDVKRTVEALRANGVTFEEYDMPGIKTVNGVASMGELQSAWFKDPDGNILAVGNL